MATLTVQTSSRTGTDLTSVAVSAAGGGDKFPNTGQQLAWFNNGSGSPITITMVLQATLDGQTASNKTYSLAAGHSAILGPFPTSTYNDGNAAMNFTYSGVTSLTVAVFQLGS